MLYKNFEKFYCENLSLLPLPRLSRNLASSPDGWTIVLTKYWQCMVGKWIGRDCSIRAGCSCEVPRLSWDTWRLFASLRSPCVWRRSEPTDLPRSEGLSLYSAALETCSFYLFRRSSSDTGRLIQGTDLCDTCQSFTTAISPAVGLISSRQFHRPLPPDVHTYIHVHTHTHTHTHTYAHQFMVKSVV